MPISRGVLLALLILFASTASGAAIHPAPEPPARAHSLAPGHHHPVAPARHSTIPAPHRSAPTARPVLPGPLLLLALLLAPAGGAILLRVALRRLAPRRYAWWLLRREIRARRRTLRERRQRFAGPGRGNNNSPAWRQDRLRFARTRLLPLLRRHRLSAHWPALERRALQRIERSARPRPVAAATVRAYAPDMPPADYERFCATLLDRAGWDARVTGGAGDQGADILATRRGRVLVVQCKLYGGAVGNAAVQQVSAARMHHRADLAAVVSNSRYTEGARRLAASNAVLLLHHEDLVGADPFPRGGRV